MTTKSRKPMIRPQSPSIHGQQPPRRIQAGVSLGMGVGVPIAPPVGSLNGSPVAVPQQDTRKMKNAELRGKIAKLERENAALAQRLARLQQAIETSIDKLSHGSHSAVLVAGHLREALEP